MFWEVFGVGYYFVVLYVLSVLLVFGCYIYLVFVEGVVVDDWVGGVVVDIGYWGEVNVDVGQFYLLGDFGFYFINQVVVLYGIQGKLLWEVDGVGFYVYVQFLFVVNGYYKWNGFCQFLVLIDEFYLLFWCVLEKV